MCTPLQAAKALLQKRFDASVTGDFRRFFGLPAFDRLARTAIQHFLARFEHDLLTKARAYWPKSHRFQVSVQPVFKIL